MFNSDIQDEVLAITPTNYIGMILQLLKYVDWMSWEEAYKFNDSSVIEGVVRTLGS
jgi:hypothetical protein